MQTWKKRPPNGGLLTRLPKVLGLTGDIVRLAVYGRRYMGATPLGQLRGEVCLSVCLSVSHGTDTKLPQGLYNCGNTPTKKTECSSCHTHTHTQNETDREREMCVNTRAYVLCLN